MLNLIIPMDQNHEIALALIEDAKELGMSVTEYALSVLRNATTARTANANQSLPVAINWLAEAVKRAQAVKQGAEFKLQDLFSLDEWRQVPGPTSFGRKFRQEVEPNLAVHIGRTPQNQAIYERC